MSKFRDLVIGTALVTALATPALADRLGLGRAALPEEIAAWDLDVSPDGTGLPPGSGDVLTGEELFSASCAACHGEFAEGIDNWPELAGGQGTLDHDDPVKTVGSYWPHLSTAWDYVNRSMPYGNAQSLAPDDVYAIVAYILYSNNLVDEDFVLSNDNFSEVVLPNAEGFIIDDRDAVEVPLFSAAACMTNCKDSVEITMRASILDVTPDDQTDDAPAGQEAAATPEAAPAVVVAAEAAPATPEPAAETAVAAVDPALLAEGEKAFKKCAACHKVGEGARNGTGPQLNGIVGRVMGTVEGFRYSKPMADAGAAGMIWDAAALDGFLADPKGFMPKNKMSFAGLKKPDERAAVIAYLSSFGG